MPHNHCSSIFLIPSSDGVAVPSCLACVVALFLFFFVLGFFLFVCLFVLVWFFLFFFLLRGNEIKIDVSFGILSKFYKGRKRKSVGACHI